jgi:hypothetical protein
MTQTDDGQAADDHEGEREYWLYLVMHGGYCRVVGEGDNWTVAHQMTGDTGRLFSAAPALLDAARCALADLEGIMPEFDCDGDREHPAWKTIEELRQAIAKVEWKPGWSVDGFCGDQFTTQEKSDEQADG